MIVRNIYVSSDVHGQYDEWVQSLMMSGFKPENGDKLIILGDMIDRGPNSEACLSFALSLCDLYPDNVTYLIGNHEKMFLDYVNTDPTDLLRINQRGSHWFRNGGLETVKSLLEHKTETEFLDYYATHKRLRASDYISEYIDKLNKLEYYHVDEENHIVYVHAGFRSGIRLEEQSVRDMIYIREDFSDGFTPVPNDTLDNKTIIHGHTPVQLIKDNDQKTGHYDGGFHINIDGGAGNNENIVIYNINSQTSTVTPINSKDD